MTPNFLKPFLMKFNSKLKTIPKKPIKIFIINNPTEIILTENYKKNDEIINMKQLKKNEESNDLNAINQLTEYEQNEYEAEFQAAETESQIGMEEADPNKDLDIDYDDRMNEKVDLSTDDEDESKLEMPPTPFKCLIIDCAPINFIDTVGVKTLRQLITDFNEIGIKVYLADCNGIMIIIRNDIK
jgi:hypothetical protein